MNPPVLDTCSRCCIHRVQRLAAWQGADFCLHSQCPRHFSGSLTVNLMAVQKPAFGVATLCHCPAGVLQPQCCVVPVRLAAERTAERREEHQRNTGQLPQCLHAQGRAAASPKSSVVSGDTCNLSTHGNRLLKSVH